VEGLTAGLHPAGADAASGQQPGGGQRVGRPSHVRMVEQQSKWGFVPGEEDTMMLDMKMPGDSVGVLTPMI